MRNSIRHIRIAILLHRTESFLIVNVLLGDHDCRRAAGHAHIEGQMAGVAPHDLHDGTALMGLHGVPQLVNGVQRGIASNRQ